MQISYENDTSDNHAPSTSKQKKDANGVTPDSPFDYEKINSKLEEKSHQKVVAPDLQQSSQNNNPINSNDSNQSVTPNPYQTEFNVIKDVESQEDSQQQSGNDPYQSDPEPEVKSEQSNNKGANLQQTTKNNGQRGNAFKGKSNQNNNSQIGSQSQNQSQSNVQQHQHNGRKYMKQKNLIGGDNHNAGNQYGVSGLSRAQGVKREIELKDLDFLKGQHVEELSNVRVYFPFAPYDCQQQYMIKVIQALQKSENALLESPTGTGKTLSLLCASLAWLKVERDKQFFQNSNKQNQEEKKELPKIVYTSRTHSQLAQVQRELKNTAYEPRTVLIASRDHLCVNSDFNTQKGFQLNAACKNAQKGLNPCHFYKNRDKAREHLTWEPFDIEDLHKLAYQHEFCPYYATKERATQADLIFMPYNYLIDEKIRENFDINFGNTLLIFDEAHNITSAQEEVTSFELRTKTLEQCLNELGQLQAFRPHDDQKEWKSTDEQIKRLKELTNNFLSYMRRFDLSAGIHPQAIEVKEAKYLPPRNLVLAGSQMFDIFFEGATFKIKDEQSGNTTTCNLQGEWASVKFCFEQVLLDISDQNQKQNPERTNLEVWLNVLKKVIDLWENTSLLEKAKDASEKNKKAKAYMQASDSSARRLKGPADDFYFFIYEENDNFGSKKHMKQSRTMYGIDQSQQSRVFGFWCFNAGVGFKMLAELNPRSILLTSGTLSPLLSFEAELQLGFVHKLENPHVIRNDQVQIYILKKGASGQQEFKFDYSNRENFEMLDELGETLAKVANRVPGGILVFFPSYKLMNETWDRWEKADIIGLICQSKQIYKEPTKADEYQKTVDSYYSSIYEGDKRGAILMGVCRGKISEGLDFSDNAARMVIIVGIPFPQMYDPKVILKRNYLDSRIAKTYGQYGHVTSYYTTQDDDQLQNKHFLSGREWYNQQATRAVNQAIGRVIRHKQDFGTILLVDSRYSYQSNRSQISKWLRESVKEPRDYNHFEMQLCGFYQKMNSLQFKPKVEQLEQIRINFDDAGNQEGGVMPKMVNSKDKFAVGPTNNPRNGKGSLKMRPKFNVPLAQNNQNNNQNSNQQQVNVVSSLGFQKSEMNSFEESKLHNQIFAAGNSLKEGMNQDSKQNTITKLNKIKNKLLNKQRPLEQISKNTDQASPDQQTSTIATANSTAATLKSCDLENTQPVQKKGSNTNTNNFQVCPPKVNLDKLEKFKFTTTAAATAGATNTRAPSNSNTQISAPQPKPKPHQSSNQRPEQQADLPLDVKITMKDNSEKSDTFKQKQHSKPQQQPPHQQQDQQSVITLPPFQPSISMVDNSHIQKKTTSSQELIQTLKTVLDQKQLKKFMKIMKNLQTQVTDPGNDQFDLLFDLFFGTNAPTDDSLKSMPLYYEKVECLQKFVAYLATGWRESLRTYFNDRNVTI